MIRLNPYLTKEVEVSGESCTFSISKFPEEKITKLFECVRKKIDHHSNNNNNDNANENSSAQSTAVHASGAYSADYKTSSKFNNKSINTNNTKADDSICDEKQQKKYKDIFSKYKNIHRQLSKRNADHSNMNLTRKSTSNILSKDDTRREHKSKHVKTFSTSSIINIVEVDRVAALGESSDYLNNFDGTSSFADKEYINGPYCDYFDLNSYFRMLSFSKSCLKTKNHLIFDDQASGVSAVCTDTNKSTPTNTSPDFSKTSKNRKNTSSSTFAENVPELRKLKPLISNENYDDHFNSDEISFKGNNSSHANPGENSEVFDSYEPTKRGLYKKSTFDTYIGGGGDDNYNMNKTRKSSVMSIASQSTLLERANDFYGGSPSNESNKDSISNREVLSVNQIFSYNDAEFDLGIIGDPMELISLPKDTLVRYIFKLKNTVEQMQNPEYPIERRKMSTSSRGFSNAKMYNTPSINSEMSSSRHHIRRKSTFSSILYAHRPQNNNISLDFGGTILEEDDPLAILYKRNETMQKQPSEQPKKKKNKNKK